MQSSFARHYRPQGFADLLGQKTLVQTLQGGIQSQRIVRALILSGIRGTGKTTTARIYAKALNCVSGPTPTPCSQCESCVAIRDGFHEDVVEIDGASHTGVDDIRKLKESSQYVCQRGRYKIYIIDEVHMLSTNAFNALLKLIEEPPEHVIFIFATTEVHKIPDTIISRCQLFLLNKIPSDIIATRLRHVLTTENIPFQESTIKRIAKKAQGSLRDALTMLEQMVLLGQGQLSDLGFRASYEELHALCLGLLERDRQKCVDISVKLSSQGQDIFDLVEELCEYIHFAMLCKETGNVMIEDEKEALEVLAKKAQSSDLNRIFRTLLQCSKDLVGSDMDIYIFQNYLMEWCLDPGIGHSVSSPVTQQADDVQKTEMPSTGNTTAFPPSWSELVALWKKQRPLQARLLEETYVTDYSPENISVLVKNKSMAAAKLLEPQVRERIREELKSLFSFSGVFTVTIKEQEDLDGKESLLEQREEEKARKHNSLKEEALSHPLTQELVNTLDARIIDVQIKDTP